MSERFRVPSTAPAASRLLSRVAVVGSIGVLLGFILRWSPWEFVWEAELHLEEVGLGLPIPNVFLLFGLIVAATAAFLGWRRGLSKTSHRALRWSATYTSVHWLIGPIATRHHLVLGYYVTGCACLYALWVSRRLVLASPSTPNPDTRALLEEVALEARGQPGGEVPRPAGEDAATHSPPLGGVR
jgi:hypothetical protein